MIQGYGLTETSPVICSAGPGNAAPGLVGGFVEGWEHQIRDGRLWVRGPHLMLGYWGDPLATKARLDSDGWFDTGDLVELDAAFGQLRILGRADDVIVFAKRTQNQSCFSRVAGSADRWNSVRNARVGFRACRLVD